MDYYSITEAEFEVCRQVSENILYPSTHFHVELGWIKTFLFPMVDTQDEEQYPEIYKELKICRDCPLEEVPLHMNSPHESILILVTWRLRIGR